MSFAQPFSNYEILDRIGSGAMGTVFKARQKHMNRIVALKVLKPSLARDTRYVERLKREAQIVGQLNHPNIVTGYDLGAEGGYHFFVMEFVEGRSLKELLEEWGAFTEDRVLDVAVQAARALEHAFEVGIIHRDIKPANLLIDSRNHVKVTDMGLAKVATDLTLTREGATVGTPQYISPEQAKNPRDVDVRSDLYSLGATLFHMATGQAPFRAESIGELIAKVLHERAPSAMRLNPALSDGLSLVIRKLLAKAPDLRYQTPSDLLRDLERVHRNEAPKVDLRELERDSARARRRFPSRLSSPLLWAASLGLLGGIGGTLAVYEFAGIDVSRGPEQPEYPTEATLGERLTLARSQLEVARSRGASPQSVAVWNAERLRLVGLIDRTSRARLRSLQTQEADEVEAAVRRFDTASVEVVADNLLALAFADPIGLEPGAIEDPDLAQRLRGPIERFRERVRVIFDLERGALLDRFESFQKEVGSAAIVLASAGRFHAARDLVASSLERFLAAELEGRGLDRARLPTTVQEDLEQADGRFVASMDEQLSIQEARAIDRLQSASETVAQGFRQVLREVVQSRRPIDSARARLAALQQQLIRFHPPAKELGTAGRELWGNLDQAYRSARLELEVEADALELDHAESLRSLAYDLVPTLGPRSAADWLQRVVQVELNGLELDLRILRAAGHVVEAVRELAVVPEVVSGQAADVAMRVIEEPGRAPIVVAPLGADRPFTSVPFARLQESLPDLAFPSAEDRALGAVFWYLVEGERDAAWALLAEVDAEAAVEVRDRLVRTLRSVGARAGVESARAVSTSELLSAMSRGDVDGVRQAFDRFGEPRNERESGILQTVRSWLSRNERVRARIEELRAALPAEVRIVDDPERDITNVLVEVDPAVLAQPGFDRDGETIRRVQSRTESFERSREHSLVVPGPPRDPDDIIVFEHRLSLTDLPGQASLTFQVDGQAFALGCFGRDWTLVAAELPVSDLDDEAAIQARFRTALLASFEPGSPRALPAAWHRVEIALGPTGAVLSVDGVELAQQDRRPSSGEDRALRVTAFGDFRFDGFRWLLPIPD